MVLFMHEGRTEKQAESNSPHIKAPPTLCPPLVSLIKGPPTIHLASSLPGEAGQLPKGMQGAGRPCHHGGLGGPKLLIRGRRRGKRANSYRMGMPGNIPKALKLPGGDREPSKARAQELEGGRPVSLTRPSCQLAHSSEYWCLDCEPPHPHPTGERPGQRLLFTLACPCSPSQHQVHPEPQFPGLWRFQAFEGMQCKPKVCILTPV